MLLSFGLRAHAASAPGTAAAATRAPRTAVAKQSPERVELPLLAYAYTRQVQVGTLARVLQPGFGLGIEYPRWQAAVFSFFPTAKLGFEHQQDVQQRWYVGVAPAVRVDPSRYWALQLSLDVNAAYLRSLWTPYQFDSDVGTWSRGESELKFAWLLGLDLTLWFKAHARWDIGANYGLGAVYPLAPANDVPLLPLTRLGLCGRWVYGK